MNEPKKRVDLTVESTWRQGMCDEKIILRSGADVFAHRNIFDSNVSGIYNACYSVSSHHWNVNMLRRAALRASLTRPVRLRRGLRWPPLNDYTQEKNQSSD